MASVLGCSAMSDPFAPPAVSKLVDDPAARYPTPPFSPPSNSPSHHTSRTSTASTRASSSSSRQPPSRGHPQHVIDEFGSFKSPPSASVPPARPTHAPTMPHLPTVGPTASTSNAYASSHAHAASTSAAGANHRKRQSHNPAGTMDASPPRSEYLSDEYVLHPSVHAYKIAHPNRMMIALGQYILLQTLGEGEFGKVKLGVHSDYGVEVAIKLIRRGQLDDETRANKVEREIEVLKGLKHPNIVRMLDVIDTAKYIGIVLEFAGGGELFDYILANRYLKEKDASRLFAQLISGVDYLHQKHIVHRDLKLENLLLDKHRNIIITDFGFANRFERDSDDLMATSCGSPCYAAPELVVSEGLYVGTAVDVWSCGVILYAMLSGYLPYDDDPANPDGDNINLLYKYIMTTSLNFPDHMSRLARDLLSVMLVPDPTVRCTIPQIEDHLWLAPHQALFERGVPDHEMIFTENMFRKSQQAKNELAHRRRLQQEAKMAKELQRSHSSAPGTGGHAALIDRRDKERHRTALPGTTTMPDFLYNANSSQFGTAMASSASDRFNSGPTDMEVSYSLPKHVPMGSSTPMPYLPQPPIPVGRSQSMSVRNSAPKAPLPEIPQLAPAQLNVVDESSPLASGPTTPTRPPRATKAPLSANKNRHTVQLEYDAGDDPVAWEKLKADLRTVETKPQPSLLEPRPEAPVTPDPVTLHATLEVPQATTDTELESSSEMDHSDTPMSDLVPVPRVPSIEPLPSSDAPLSTPIDHTSSPAAVEPEPVSSSEATVMGTATVQDSCRAPSIDDTPPVISLKPVAVEEPSIPPTLSTTPEPSINAPSSAATSPMSRREPHTPPLDSPSQMSSPAAARPKPSHSPASENPSTPSKRHRETEANDARERLMSTPKAAPTSSQTVTPRAAPTRDVPRTSVLPPTATTPTRKRADLVTKPEALVPVLKATGERPAGRHGRPRMSLDKFSLTKLLGHAEQARTQEKKPLSYIPTSQHHKSASVAYHQTATASMASSTDKKSRRKTLHLMNPNNSRSGSPDFQPEPPVSANSTASSKTTPLVSADGIQPRPSMDQGQGTTSFVTVDAYSSQRADNHAPRTASSSAARRVMDWFRRKSLAKDALASVRSTGPANARDSTSSISRASVSIDRSDRPPPKSTTQGHKASLDHLAVSETSSIGDTETGGPAIVIEPPNGTTLVDTKPTTPTKLSPVRPGATGTPVRSKSVRTPTSPRNKVHSAAGSSIALVSPQTVAEAKRFAPSHPSPDETKMRLHAGLVDQSALTSRPPKEVMAEVVNVLHGMGMDIKQETEYKLRCTRVRRRKAGPTTSLSLLGTTSVNRTDMRGLPLPQSPSSGGMSGLKGMLLRRGSSYSSHYSAGLARSESDLVVSSSSTPGLISPALGPVVEPLYGEHSIDTGDEVKFVIELCRIKNLQGLYLLSIKRIKGSVWSFKFIYQTIVERCETLTH